MDREGKNILGVFVDGISMNVALERAQGWLDSDTQHMIVTPNPEILLEASRNDDYAAVLNGADMALPDGRGVQMLARLPERVTGVDFSERLLALAAQRGERVVCVVRADGLSDPDVVEKTIKRKFSDIDVTAVGVAIDGWDADVIIDELLELKPAILLVGLGFPQQEQFLAHHLDHIPSARIGIGVGGTFDFWTGAATRAPRWIRAMGFEWLYRVIREPRRLKRIWSAVVVFPLKAFLK